MAGAIAVRACTGGRLLYMSLGPRNASRARALAAAFPAQFERPPPCDALGLDVPYIFNECNP